MLSVTPEIQIPTWEFDVSFARSSGPGGQNVNKVNSKAVLRWQVLSSAHVPDAVKMRFLATYHSRLTGEGILVLSSDKFRDQRRNIQNCLEKLRKMILAVARPPKVRKATKPSRSSIKDRLQKKERHSSKKQSRRPVRNDD